MKNKRNHTAHIVNLYCLAIFLAITNFPDTDKGYGFDPPIILSLDAIILSFSTTSFVLCTCKYMLYNIIYSYCPEGQMCISSISHA